MEAPERGVGCRAHVRRGKMDTGDKRPRKSQRLTRTESPTHGGEQVCPGTPQGTRDNSDKVTHDHCRELGKDGLEQGRR